MVHRLLDPGLRQPLTKPIYVGASCVYKCTLVSSYPVHNLDAAAETPTHQTLERQSAVQSGSLAYIGLAWILEARIFIEQLLRQPDRLAMQLWAEYADNKRAWDSI